MHSLQINRRDYNQGNTGFVNPVECKRTQARSDAPPRISLL